MLLRSWDQLEIKPQRILVAGTSGSGKTTMAAALAEVLNVPHTEIDGLFHGPEWTRRRSFLADVETLVHADRWVTEWQYREVRGLLADHADLVVWLDLPRALVMQQVIARTIRRRLHREVLWNGNVEPSLWSIFTDRDHIIRWAWRTYPTSIERMYGLQRSHPELPVIRLRSHEQIDAWLRGLAGEELSTD